MGALLGLPGPLGRAFVSGEKIWLPLCQSIFVPNIHIALHSCSHPLVLYVCMYVCMYVYSRPLSSPLPGAARPLSAEPPPLARRPVIHVHVTTYVYVYVKQLTPLQNISYMNILSHSYTMWLICMCSVACQLPLLNPTCYIGICTLLESYHTCSSVAQRVLLRVIILWMNNFTYEWTWMSLVTLVCWLPCVLRYVYTHALRRTTHALIRTHTHVQIYLHMGVSGGS